MTRALERSRTGLATVPSPHLAYAAPKVTRPLLTSKQLGSDG